MSPKAKETKRVFGYVRVSRVAGRDENGDGAAFISPKAQRESIDRWCQAYGIELVEAVEELDVSGGKRVSDRKLGDLIQRTLDGEADGIVVWRLSRFGRNLADVVANVDRLTDAGKRFVAIEENVDTGAKGSALVLGIFAGLAQVQREAIAESWDNAVRAAIKRGTHVGPTPVGYQVRNVDGVKRLVVADVNVAATIDEAFMMRGQGRSLAEIARFLTEEGVLPLERRGRRSVAWSRSGVAALLSNRVYLGEVRSKGHVNRAAHKPIVSADVFALAQRGSASETKRRQGRSKDGTIAHQGLLVSLVWCRGCGHRLSTAASTSGKTGERQGVYACRIHHATTGDLPGAGRGHDAGARPPRRGAAPQAAPLGRGRCADGSRQSQGD
jgi:site-specific DNA recombinase